MNIVPIDFFTLLSIMCYIIVCVNMKTNKSKKGFIVFCITTILFVFLHLTDFQYVYKELGNFFWGIFNVTIAAFVLYQSNIICETTKKLKRKKSIKGKGK